MGDGDHVSLRNAVQAYSTGFPAWLQQLDLRGHCLNLRPLSSCTSLTQLSLSGCMPRRAPNPNVEDPSPLTALTRLRHLTVRRTLMTGAPNLAGSEALPDLHLVLDV
jgi:hypothetical protein